MKEYESVQRVSEKETARGESGAGSARAKRRERIREAAILFAGDSGDGSQTIGAQMTETSAIAGNDVATFPDFPAEIRAPAGSLAGVSGFQLRFSSNDIHTPGDECDVLVAMNPAALRVHLEALKPNGILIINVDNFTPRNLKLAGYESDPLKDGSLDRFQVFPVELTRLTREALRETDLTPREVDLCKNFFALGMVFWLYNRPLDFTLKFIAKKFAHKPRFIEANTLALRAGYNYCDMTEQFATSFEVRPAQFPPGTYRNISGNSATALALVAAAHKAGLPLVYGSYPITPASEILHELARYRHFGVKTMQMEDEIAAIGVAIGAGFAGALGATGSSGPGLALMSEAINLAVMTELPVVICNVQRAGPSTGMPTKTEQSDLLQMLYGRNGDSPVPVLAAASPADCFHTCYECCRLAIKFMTPVIMLSDLYIAFGAEPWRIPSVEELPAINPRFASPQAGQEFLPYARDAETLARPWAIPGTPGLEHRIGGLEKEHLTGQVSYDPENHDLMTHLRWEKIQRISGEIPPTPVYGDPSGRLLVLGWGGTFGALRTAVERKREEGASVSHVHLRYLNPFPPDLGEILARFDTVLVPELNLGQLRHEIRARFLVDAIGYNRVTGRPFTVSELIAKIEEVLRD